MRRLITPTPWALSLIQILLISCTAPVMPGTSAPTPAYVEGTAMLPANGTTGTLAEQAAVGGLVRLLSRDGAETASQTTVDGLGHFKVQTPASHGLFIVDVTLGTRHVKSLVQVQPGRSLTTTIDVASSLIAARLLASSLRLAGLDESRFHVISSQAHALMTMADVPNLATDAGTSVGAETFLNSHLVIKQQVDELLLSLAQLEGVPLASVLPAATPGALASPTPRPDPVYTPEPTPAPSQVPAGLSSLTVMGERLLDSAPGWLANEGSNMLWVSCPASNSIMRFERSSTTWKASRPMSPRIASPFMPAQLAVNVPLVGTATVWVANQHPSGTKVAYCDTLGNFLGTVEVGPKPSALGIDTGSGSPHVWMGANVDGSGKVVVSDLSGNILTTTQTAGPPFRFQGARYGNGLGDSMWIATPRAVYRVPLAAILPTSMTIGTNSDTRFDFNGAVGDGSFNPDLNHQVSAMAVTALGDVWVVLQDPGSTQAALVLLYEEASNLLQAIQTKPFTVSAPVTGLVVDPTKENILLVSTANELLRFGNGSIERTSVSQLHGGAVPPPLLKGLFVGADFTFWAALDAPAKLLKLYP